MIELVALKTTVSLPVPPPAADFVRHRGQLYAATDDPQVWELHEGSEPADGARVIDVDARRI